MLVLEDIKYKRSPQYTFIITALMVIVSLTVGNLFRWYYVERKDAVLQLNELLSNFISLLGIGLAILAILFAIIQLAYRQLSIITLLIKESFFLPVFYFGMLNIFLCGVLATFQYGRMPFNDFIYVRLVVTESYFFWLLVPMLCLVFFKAVKLTNFSYITELYLKNVYRLVIEEKFEKTKIEFRETLQFYGLEIREEISRLIAENKIILLNKFFDFYLSIIKLNHNSNLLEDIHQVMQRWFIQSYKISDKTVFKNLISTWWNFYSDLLAQNSFDKTRFLSTLPLNLYNEYRKTKDEDIKFISIEVFPIRLKELGQSRLFKMIKERTNFEIELQKIETTLNIFPELIKSTIDEDDEESLEKLFSQIRLFINSMEYDKETLENKFKLEPQNITEEDKKLKDVIDNLLQRLNSFFVTAYGWIIYKKDEK